MIPKFRAWDKLTDTVQDVLDINFKEKTVTVSQNDIVWYKHDNLRPFEGVILMQSTGLKDKNGVEIFDGDVVRYTWDMLSDVNATEKGKKVRISKVFWSDWRASWAVGKNSCNNDLFRYARNGNTVEVLGNVWEDGDLLDDNKETECNRAY